MNRRAFLGASAASLSYSAVDKPAILGGEPVRKSPFPAWPISNSEEERAIVAVLRAGKWNRASMVERFEAAYAKLLGSRACLATANGTSALLTALSALGVKPGDEVIVPPYTFVATINVVLQLGAVPVFVDSDRETSQIDATKIEAAVTPKTAAIMPVHLGGNVADLDAILEIGKKRGLPVIEDACQAHLAEWRGRKVGSLGKAGCFSFQASKNLNSGEGGAMMTDDPEFLEHSFAFHNNGRGRRSGGGFTYDQHGLNLRITEFQAALLLSQMTRLADQAKRRDENAAHLTGILKDISGLQPAKQYEGCTRNAYHIYMLRYDPSAFSGLPRATFLKAMRAEGIPASPGYSPLNKQPFIQATLRRSLSAQEAANWEKRNDCPANDQLCEEAVWFGQTMLIGERKDMDDIGKAVLRIQRSAAAIRAA